MSFTSVYFVDFEQVNVNWVWGFRIIVAVSPIRSQARGNFLYYKKKLSPIFFMALFKVSKNVNPLNPANK